MEKTADNSDFYAPGEWLVKVRDGMTVIEADGVPIAHVLPAKSNGHDMQAANARLMAAAKALREHIESVLFAWSCRDEDGMAAALAQAKKAIGDTPSH